MSIEDSISDCRDNLLERHKDKLKDFILEMEQDIRKDNCTEFFDLDDGGDVHEIIDDLLGTATSGEWVDYYGLSIFNNNERYDMGQDVYEKARDEVIEDYEHDLDFDFSSNTYDEIMSYLNDLGLGDCDEYIANYIEWRRLRILK